MLFKFVFATAMCHASGLRPEISQQNDVRVSRFAEIVTNAAVTDGSNSLKSLDSLQSAASLVNSMMLQAGNATEHMSDDDKALLNSVVDLINKSIYGSMDSSHQADVAAIQAALDAVSQCNSDIAARLGEGGDLNKLHLGVVGYQNGLNDLQDDVDVKTEVNNTKFDELQRHINNIGNSADCDDFPDSPTKLKADNFFAGSEYVDWYTSRQGAYAPVAEALETADANLEDALAAYAVGLAERNVAYCDWKLELEGGCEAFDQCYQEKVDFYNNEKKPALQQDMNVRIDAYKAGQAIIAQIGFLLGESTESVPPTDIDTSRFQLNFLPVPAKGECSLSPLDSADWVPLPECSDEVRALGGCFGSSQFTGSTCSGSGPQSLRCPTPARGGTFSKKVASAELSKSEPITGGFAIEWNMTIHAFGADPLHYATILTLHPGWLRLKALDWSGSSCNDGAGHRYHLAITDQGDYTTTCDGAEVVGWSGSSPLAKTAASAAGPLKIFLGAHLWGGVAYCRASTDFSDLVFLPL